MHYIFAVLAVCALFKIMGWKCKNELIDENFNILFEVGEIYEEQDDRGDADDIAICLICKLGRKRYLADKMVRNFFDEVHYR